MKAPADGILLALDLSTRQGGGARDAEIVVCGCLGGAVFARGFGFLKTSNLKDQESSAPFSLFSWQVLGWCFAFTDTVMKPQGQGSSIVEAEFTLPRGHHLCRTAERRGVHEEVVSWLELLQKIPIV